ncbi:MAG: hypothetical protein JST73_12425 [Actinobacteria bacterium]|nr:hypothetical protein [Actinomycetota bacterium]
MKTASGLLAIVALLGACSSGGSHERGEAAATTVVAGAGSSATSSAPGAAARHVTMPTVSGPITGPGEPWNAIADVAGDSGYTSQEYFISGHATSYRVRGKLATDGRWDAEADTNAPYETRILVHRPTDPAKFNGTVVLEWLNVSAGFETAPDFLFTQRELLRAGYAWVGVSAQKGGIDPAASGGVLGIEPLKGMNPKRYAPLHHPGDQYSYDIFTQASAAVRARGARSPLGGLPVRRVIADGESQSAFRMVDYIDAVQPLTHAFDGFLVHSRWALGTPLNPDQTPPGDAIIRTDQSVPVLQVQSETDVPKYLTARQRDTAHVRTWEIAGTSHVDANVLANAMGCTSPVNSGPEVYVMDAALSALNTWMGNSADVPPTAPRIEVAADGSIERDADGNAKGGIRTPQLDVPIATLSGEGGTGPDFCKIAGTTKPFSGAKAVSLYGSKDAYMTKFDAAMADAIHKGFLLQADATAMDAAAAAAWPTS